MAELAWYEAFPPRDLELAEVTGVLRVLGGRPHAGRRALQPLVVFELWLSRNQVRWLIGIEQPATAALARQFVAQLPTLVLRPLETPSRPTPITAQEIRPSSLGHSLRLDTAGGVSAALFHLRSSLHASEQVVVQWVVGPSHTYKKQPVQYSPLALLGFARPQQPDADDRRGWQHKLSEAFLLGVRGRLGAVTADLRRASALLAQGRTALALANGSRSQLRAASQSRHVASQLVRIMGRRRTWSSLLNASELAALLGWPLVGATGVTTSSFSAPPTTLIETTDEKKPAIPQRPLGLSRHPATNGATVGIPWASYAAHVHVVGPSGVGKSTLLANWSLADATAGRSLLVVEPKGDLVSDILARLPEARRQDVVVIDPGAPGPVIGINPLRGPRADAERRADSLLYLFRELFGSAIGPRSGDVLLHSLIATSRLDDGTLADVPMFLTNAGFRTRVLTKVSDPLTLTPWAGWFESISEAERAQVVAPVLNKLRALVSRPAVRRLLSQAVPRFELDELFAQPKIVLVNLNAGSIGNETAALIGNVLLGQLWEAVQRQTTIPERRRREVAVVVDEFQQFTAALDFADVLARARGAKTSFTIAHQHLGQLNADLRAAVLANARSRVVLRPAEGDAAALARVLGPPVTPADLEQLPAFHAAARVLVDGAPSAAFEVATSSLTEPIANPDVVRAGSQVRYGIAPDSLDAAVLARWQGGTDESAAPIGSRRRRS